MEALREGPEQRLAVALAGGPHPDLPSVQGVLMTVGDLPRKDQGSAFQ